MSDPMSEIVVPAYVGPKPKKLFIGIRVSVPTANALGMAVETLARRATEAKLDVRWVPPANYHVTLRYLGYTRPELLPALRDKLALAVRNVAPFGFRTSRLGGFPSIDQAQVLWAGIEDAGQRALAALAAKIEAAVVELGFAAEPRPFHGHVTIARPREIASLAQVVLPLSEQMFSESKTDGITIIESEMKSGTSVYSDVMKIAFKSTETPSQVATKRQMGTLEMSAPHEAETDDGWPRGQGPTD